MDMTQFLLWFKESGLPQVAAVVLSVAAFGISLLSYRQTWKRDKENTTRLRKVS